MERAEQTLIDAFFLVGLGVCFLLIFAVDALTWKEILIYFFFIEIIVEEEGKDVVHVLCIDTCLFCFCFFHRTKC